MPHSDLHKVRKSKNFLVLAIIFGICVLIWAVTLIKIDRANAADVEMCGLPSGFDMSTHNHVPVCDIYSRQLQYVEKAKAFRTQVQRRAVNFAAPAAALRAQYKENLQAYHDTITEENIPSFFATWEDQ